MFQDLLLLSQRHHGTRKPVTVIHPEKHEEFFVRLSASAAPLHVKAFLSLAVSGGLRVSEALSIKDEDIELERGVVNVRVLKKRSFVKTRDGREIPAHEVHRSIVLHPESQRLLRTWLSFRSPSLSGKPFYFTRQTAFYWTKKLFGALACPHSIARHSHITWLLVEKKISSEVVSKIMGDLDVRIVAGYTHVDCERTLLALRGRPERMAAA